MQDEKVNALATAIIKTAVDDYKRALNTLTSKKLTEEKKYKTHNELIELRQFFTSDYFDLLTGTVDTYNPMDKLETLFWSKIFK